MKKLLIPFKATLSLGWLGLIILLLAGAILWAFINQSSAPFAAVQERMSVLNVLESDVQQTLNEMKVQEARKIFSVRNNQPEDKDYASLAEKSDARITELLGNLEAEGHFSEQQDYGVDIQPELKDFNDLRATHRQTFLEFIQTSNKDQQIELMDQIETEDEDLDLALQTLIVNVEQDRMQAYRDFPQDIALGIYYTAGGLTAALILALVGYQLISGATRPLGTLRNTITAIEGDQYRSEMQGSLLKKRGPAGQLARALDTLAHELQQRDSGLKIETERLRQALYESRRRRLKVYHESTNRSEQA